MKKVISFVVAIALVLSMSVCAFAAEKPTGEDLTPESLGAYYVELLNAPDADVAAIAQEFVNDMSLFPEPADMVTVVMVLTQGVVPEIMDEFMAEVEALSGVDLPGIGGNGGTEPLPDPDQNQDETPELEEDDTDSSGSFLDTILGVLGGLGDILFGGGGETPEEPSDDNDDPWNGGEEPTTDSGASQVPNQGDTSVVAVATIALVAGAALVLTRKKSEDAE